MARIKSHIEFRETYQQQGQLLSLPLDQPIFVSAAPTSSTIAESGDDRMEWVRGTSHFYPSRGQQGNPSYFLQSPRSVADVWINPSTSGERPAQSPSGTSPLYSSRFLLQPRYGSRDTALPTTLIFPQTCFEQSEPPSNESSHNTFPDDIILPSL